MAIIGVGAKLEHENGSGWLEVHKCKSVNFPGFSTTSIDTTNLGITDYGKTYLPGMVDANCITFDCEFSDATYTQLHGLIRDLTGWRVSFSVRRVRHRDLRRLPDEAGRDLLARR